MYLSLKLVALVFFFCGLIMALSFLSVLAFEHRVVLTDDVAKAVLAFFAFKFAKFFFEISSETLHTKE